jgi:Protein of unknown function (DUF1761)
MINQFANLNWLSIFIALVAYSMLGALWFTVLFGKFYKLSLGKAEETLPNKPIFIVGPTLCMFVITVTTSILICRLNIGSIPEVIEFACIIGFGFLVANTVNIAINPNIPRPILYGTLSGAYHLLGILMVCIILVGMK